MSLPWAEFISFWANWLLICALIVGVIATFGIIVSSNVKEAALKRDVAEANARAAEANEKAEQERLARVKIEVRIAPRKLTQAQQNELTVKLSGLPKQRGTVRASPSTPESEMFARVLAAPLRAAGWDIEPVAGTATATVLYPTGVVIEWATDPTNPNIHEQGYRAAAAEKLVEVLGEFGVDATAIPGMLKPPHTMEITISTK